MLVLGSSQFDPEADSLGLDSRTSESTVRAGHLSHRLSVDGKEKATVMCSFGHIQPDSAERSRFAIIAVGTVAKLCSNIARLGYGFDRDRPKERRQ